MPFNFAKAQQKLLATNFLADNAESKSQYEMIDSVLDEYVVLFLTNLEKYYNQFGVAASGKLISQAKVKEYDNGRTIYLPIYYDYVNKGVQGWDKGVNNAPNSPYKYTSKGMNAKGRASIRQYIQSSSRKIKNVDEQYKYKSESKLKRRSKKSKLDTQVDKMVWNIKKFGIKPNPFFDAAYQETFKDLEVTVEKLTKTTVEIMVKKTFEQK